MPVSTITSKGQTTIPSEVRKALGLKPNDKIAYIVDGDKVILRPIKGDILELKGKVKVASKIDFKRLREKTKQRVAKKIAMEGR